MPRPVLLRQFYELEPKTPTEVRKIWNFVHLLCLTITAVSGFVTAYAFGLFMEKFSFHCSLFAKLLVVTKESSLGLNITNDQHIHKWNKILPKTDHDELDVKKSRWGTMSVCYFVQFLHVASLLSSVIWIVFFVISGRGNEERGRQIVGKPYRLVVPFLLWCILAVILFFASNSTLASGLSNFCGYLETEDGVREMEVCFGTHKTRYVLFFGELGKDMFTDQMITWTAEHIGWFAWIFNACWTLLRIYLLIDYKMYLVNIWKFVPDHSEKVRKNVTFDDVEEEFELQLE